MHSRRASLALLKARVASVLDHLKSEAPSRVVQVEFAGSSPVEVAIVSDVLYVPALHLQLWRGAIIPDEANTDSRSLRELQLAARTGKIMAHALLPNVEQLNEDVCVLANLSSYDFFHFMEELYKVVILERAGFGGKYVFSRWPNRLAQEPPSFAYELLELLGIGPDRIARLGQPTLLQAAWYTTRISHADTPLYPGVFAALREALRGVVEQIAGVGPRIWLQPCPPEPLVNAAAVHDCLNRHGFAVVDMAELAAARQVAAASQARVLAGPHTTALVHSMFMPEHSTVIECFSPRLVDPRIIQLCWNLQHSYLQLVPTHTPLASYPYDEKVEVNCDHLELVLRSLRD